MSAVSVSGTASVVEVAAAARRRRRCSTSRPSATSVRTVSTAYSGMPSARADDRRDRRLRQARHEPGEQLAHVRLGQRLEVDRDEVALAGAPRRASLDQVRPRQGDDVDRQSAAPLEQVVDEVEQAGVGEVHVLEDAARPCPARRCARRTCARRRTAGRRPCRPRRRAGSAARARSTSRSSGSVTHCSTVSRDLVARGLLVVLLGQTGALADHLAQRPEGDALAVRRRAAAVPVDRLRRGRRCTSRNSHASRDLADARRADDADTTRSRFSRPVAWNRSLSRRISSSRPTNGASSASLRLRPPRSPTTRIARHAGTGACLPLSDLLAGRLEDDRRARGAVGRLADEHGARRRHALEAAARC